MPKNAFAAKLQQMKRQEYSDGVWEGIQMGLNLCAIALNHEFGFGHQRLKKVEAKVQTLIDEIIDTNDPEVTRYRLKKALAQIWKADEL